MVELSWSPRSENDLILIYEYISQDSPETAFKFVNELAAEAHKIPRFPYSGREVPEVKRKALRERLYGSYRIIYRIKPDEIEIVTLQHQSRKLSRKLLQ